MNLFRYLKISHILWPVLLTSFVALVFGWGWGPTLVFGTLMIAGHLLWTCKLARERMRVWMRGPPPAEMPGRRKPVEKWGQEYSLESQARTQHPLVLWLIEIVCLGFVIIGIAVLIQRPNQWLTALVAIAAFGSGLAFNTYMLVLRQRRP